MVTLFASGEKIWVCTFGGRAIERIVLEDFGDTLLLCRKEELETANSEGRAPATVEYPKEFVITPSGETIYQKARQDRPWHEDSMLSEWGGAV
jgi:hypothetical protein